MTALIMSETYCLEDKPLSGKEVMDKVVEDYTQALRLQKWLTSQEWYEEALAQQEAEEEEGW